MWFGKKGGVILVAGALSALALAGCTGTADGNVAGSLSTSQLEALGRASSGLFNGTVQGTGIHVQGIGKVSGQPDVAVLSLGVEGFAQTVTEARDIAATAMDGLLAALRSRGVANDDIKSQHFNIQPEYTFEEIVTPRGGALEGSIRRSERKLVGYRVTNSLTAKVRDLSRVGEIVDAVVDAGGDATRLNSIQFTVDDGTALEARARELALADALSKADLYATKLGAKRGKLQFVTESSFPQFAKAESFDMAAMSRAAGAPATQFSPGEFEVMVTMQAIFAID